jgi:hypothetical protein
MDALKTLWLIFKERKSGGRLAAARVLKRASELH